MGKIGTAPKQIFLRYQHQICVKVSRKEPKCRVSETNTYWSTSSGGCMVLKSLQPAGENYAYRGRRSGEPSQSVTKPGRRMGRRPEQKTVQSEWRGMRQASINERFSAPGLVGRLPGGINRQGVSGRAGLEGTHSTNTHDSTQNYTTTLLSNTRNM